MSDSPIDPRLEKIPPLEPAVHNELILKYANYTLEDSLFASLSSFSSFPLAKVEGRLRELVNDLACTTHELSN